MGSFINSQSDNEICEALNKRFSDDVNPNDSQKRTYLRELRDFFQNMENLFDGNHHLHRVFHRLAITVTGGKSVPKTKNSRLRWLLLLHGNLPAAVDQAIRGQLSAILSPATGANPAGAVDYVTFSTVHAATSTGDQFELDPQNSQTPRTLTDSNNKSYGKILLKCNADQQLSLNPLEKDPPPKQGGEKGLSNKSSAKKSSAKKTVKKKTSAKKKKAASKTSSAKKAGKREYRR